MQNHYKLEMAARPNKCSADFLKKCSDYYHSGIGKEKQKQWLARRTPEQIEAKKAASRAWKARNKIRMSLLRWATSTKRRASLKNSAVADIGPWDLIGCNVVEFQAHVESMFREGIGWHNRKEWELDHIRPLCDFDLTDMEQVRECLHFSNVQVLIIGAHLEKAKTESMAFMEKLAREHWLKHGDGKYPGFKTAWRSFTIFRSCHKEK